jgi:hypothetical protein
MKPLLPLTVKFLAVGNISSMILPVNSLFDPEDVRVISQGRDWEPAEPHNPS